jgi:hypothetical protein
MDRWPTTPPDPHPQGNCGPLTLPLAVGDTCPTCGTIIAPDVLLMGPETVRMSVLGGMLAKMNHRQRMEWIASAQPLRY